MKRRPRNIYTEEQKALMWNEHVGHLRIAGLITNVDVTQFALYCDTLVLYREAVEAYSDNPTMVLQTPSGYAMQNPYLSIVRETKKDLYRMAAEFGMTPSPEPGLDPVLIRTSTR